MTTPPRRCDGNLHSYYDFDENDPKRPHFIEQTLAVYLRLSDDGRRWIVDAPTVDGIRLDSVYDDELAKNDECGCGRPEECERIRDAADELPLPTAEELIDLILDALPRITRG